MECLKPGLGREQAVLGGHTNASVVQRYVHGGVGAVAEMRWAVRHHATIDQYVRDIDRRIVTRFHDA